MRRHFYTMLLGAFVLASAFGEADSFNPNGGETETMIEGDVQTQEPNVGEADNFVGGEGTQPEATEDQIDMFFGESTGRSDAGTGDEALSGTDEPNPTETEGQVDIPAEETQPSPNVGDEPVTETDTPASEIEPKTDVDQEPTVSDPPGNVGFFEMVRSFFNVFAGSVGPSPVEINSQTPRPIGRYFVSDEDSHSFEDDTSDEMPPPMPVQLARIKQFVRVNTATVRASTSYDDQEDHPLVTKPHVVGRSQTPAPPIRGGRVIVDSDEHDYDHSDEQDTSLEVDFSLLPEIRRFLEPNAGRDDVINHYEEPDGRGTRGILENPIFQQKVLEFDSRLKRASGASGKRLMEKYAEALAVYSDPSVNMASTSVTFSCFLPFVITCLLARIS
ncbi:hypothetical protein GHT06_012451 [Daphnia sinensis]|uniref:Uncharacterized protein n=1 Tax=Daphnia sinensis TaxID=1820382 RepID=A0AAD5PX92_9CRUS|nr:hypothetical protein GHT06_012451 [Daphnia sinensis]